MTDLPASIARAREAAFAAVRKGVQNTRDALNEAFGAQAATDRAPDGGDLRRTVPAADSAGRLSDPPRRTLEYGPGGGLRVRTPFDLVNQTGTSLPRPEAPDEAFRLASSRITDQREPEGEHRTAGPAVAERLMADPTAAQMLQEMASGEGVRAGARLNRAQIEPGNAPDGSFQPDPPPMPPRFRGALRDTRGGRETMEDLTLGEYARGVADYSLDPDAMRRVRGPGAMLAEPPPLHDRPAVPNIFAREFFKDWTFPEDEPAPPRRLSAPHREGLHRGSPVIAPFNGGGARMMRLVQTPEQAQALPPGTRYRTPQGEEYVR